MEVYRPASRLVVFLALCLCLLIAVHTSSASQSSEIFILVRDASTNLVLRNTNATLTPPPPPWVVDSNGMVHLNINPALELPQQEEILPGGTCDHPLDINQVLAIYAEVAGVQIQVAPEVRQFSGVLKFPAEIPAMTRTQAREFIEATLRQQAAVQIIHSDDQHAIVKYQEALSPPEASK